MTNEDLTADEWTDVQNDLRAHLDEFRSEYEDTANNNEKVKETDDYVIFADGSGHELNEIAEIVGVDVRALSQRMHDEARKRYSGEGSGDPWSYRDPVVVLKEDDGNDLKMLDTADGHPDEPNPDQATVQIGSDTVQVQLEYEHPGIDGFDVEFDVETRSVNQFARFETYKNSESKSTYDRYNARKIGLLYREGDEWYYGVPEASHATRDKARYPQSDLDPDGHLPTQVDGVTERKIAHRSNRRDGFQKYRYKVTREFVEQVDEAFVLEWKEKHEAGREGSYTRQSETVAHKLALED